MYNRCIPSFLLTFCCTMFPIKIIIRHENHSLSANCINHDNYFYGFSYIIKFLMILEITVPMTIWICRKFNGSNPPSSVARSERRHISKMTWAWWRLNCHKNDKFISLEWRHEFGSRQYGVFVTCVFYLCLDVREIWIETSECVLLKFVGCQKNFKVTWKKQKGPETECSYTNFHPLKTISHPDVYVTLQLDLFLELKTYLGT